MRTRRQLITDALRQIRVLAAGETPVAEDFDLVSDAYAEVLASLRDRGLAYWPDTGVDVEEIPLPVYGALTSLLASQIADAFGKPAPVAAEETGQQAPAFAVAMRDLRRHIAKRPSGEPTTFSSY